MSATSLCDAFSHRNPFLPIGPAIHHEIQYFLFHEALLLDHQRYDEWLRLLTAEIRYRTPTHFARAMGIEPPSGVKYLEDNHQSLTARIQNISMGKCGTQGPMHRFVSNVIVCPRGRDEYDVLSYLLITQGNPADHSGWLISAERYDRLRRAWLSFKIVEREIVVDQRQSLPRKIDLFL